MNSALGEFGRIASIFAPLTEGVPGALGLADDAALLAPDLVLTTDAIVEGVDFLPDDPPDQIARKLLRVNLSDLAAMGARPEAYLLTTILPARIDDRWLAAFAQGLAEDQQYFGIRLIGGDSGLTPGPMTFSATLIGRAPSQGVVKRAGAVAGDTVFASGTIGDSALGLKVATGQLSLDEPEHAAFLVERYRIPQPRTALGMALAGHASAMIDISDGLVADLDHLCRASCVSAEIDGGRVPLSAAAAAVLAKSSQLLETVLTGGDDYELLFTAPGARASEIMVVAERCGTAVRPIGTICQRPAASPPRTEVIGSGGGPIQLRRTGWRHA